MGVLKHTLHCGLVLVLSLPFLLLPPSFANQQVFNPTQHYPTNLSFDGRSIIINQTRQLILSGSVHYSRVLPSDWDRVFRLSKELHLNTIQTYFFWNFHETNHNNITWDGRRDLIRFIQLAQQHNLYVNLRIGPYVCGEYYFGGLPLWLRTLDNITCFRCSDPVWKREMKRVIQYVTDKVRPYLAQNGGNIILLQVENEYNGGDQDYLNWAVDMANNATAQEQAYWSLCHDHTMCAATNRAGNRAICTINGFWMDEYNQNPSQPSPKWMQDQQQANSNQPLIWTEDQGWFDQWMVGQRIRSSQDQMYGILRFTAYGGTWHNHYMVTGGSNFGLQAGGEVVTSYAPDTVIDSFLLRHEPRFTLFSKMYAVLSSAETSQALLNTRLVPAAISLSSNATNQSQRGTTAVLDSCTDTDPAHMGELDASQLWEVIAATSTPSAAGYHQLKNLATGLCIDATHSMLHRVSLSECGRQNNLGLLWRLTNESHVESLILRTCVSAKAKKDSQCHQCFDVNKKEPLGVWDCHNKHSGQASNQWFHLSNNRRGLRSNRSGLCVTAVRNAGSRVELHNYDGGLSFISNTDASNWLAVQPFANASNLNWSFVLAPVSVVVVNRSTVPPTLLFNTAETTFMGSNNTHATPPMAATRTANNTSTSNSSWEFYMETPGIGARSTTSSKGPLEQLMLTNNVVDHMWYSTVLPTAGRGGAPADPSLLNVQGRDGTILSAITIRNNTVFMLSSAMGLKNGGLTPSDGKGISIQGDGPTYNHRSLLGQPWTSTWMLPGEHLSIFDPATTNAVPWQPVGTNGAVNSASAVWFRATLTTPDVGGVPRSPAQLAYALNLTTMWKGTAYCNGFLLGRYWMVAGKCQGTCAPPIKEGRCYMHWKNCNQPTQTLYHVPNSVLNANGMNLIVLFEEVGEAPNGAPNQQERQLNGVKLVVLTHHPE